MEYEFAGLPLHVLLVHAVIVLVPLLALLLVVIAAWRAARRVLWLPALIGAAVLLPLGLVTIEAGEWLEERVPQTPLIQAHTDIGESIVPWLVALLVLAAVIAAWAVFEMVSARRAGDGEPAASRPWSPRRGQRRAHTRRTRRRDRLDLDHRADRRGRQPRRVGGHVQRRPARGLSLSGDGTRSDLRGTAPMPHVRPR